MIRRGHSFDPSRMHFSSAGLIVEMLRLLLLCVIVFLVLAIPSMHVKVLEKGKVDDMTAFYQNLDYLDDLTVMSIISNGITISELKDSIASWKQFVLPSNVLLVTDGDSCHEYVEQLNISCLSLPHCIHQDYGKMRVDCIWEAASSKIETNLFAFVKSSIILSGPIATAVEDTHCAFSRFLLIAEYSVNADERELSFWALPTDLIRKVNLPEFLVGSTKWEQYVISKFIIDESVIVVDGSHAITSTTTEKHKSDLLSRQIHEAHNHEIALRHSGLQYKLGCCSCAEYKWENDKLVPNIDKADSHLAIAFREMNSKKQLAVLTVNSGYIELAQNWLCWADRIHFSNFIFFAQDQRSFDFFRAQRVPIVSYSTDFPYESPSLKYGTEAFQRLMLERTRFLYSLLKNGIHILTSDLDAIWLENPLQHLHHRSAVQGQQHKGSKLSGGLVYVESSEQGKLFWGSVLQCQEDNVFHFAKRTAKNAGSVTEQYCINSILGELNIKPFLLPSSKFPDGKAYFDEMRPQREGTWPVIIHNNWIIGSDQKKKRFQDWDLWALDEKLQCKREKEKKPLKEGRPVIAVQVLAYDRPASFIRLIDSLINADYHRHSVPLYISVDGLSTHSSERQRLAHEQVLRSVHDIQWPHGSLHISLQEKHNGLAGQWLAFWNASNDSEVRTVFEDDIVVSPHWYTWTIEAVKAYYGKSNQLFGISLQRQHTIVAGPFQFQEPHALLKTHSIWLYQLIGTWGAVLFPQQWREFRYWMENEKPSTPCLPNFGTNLMWKKSSSNMWSAWFIRFAFEKGYFGLYSNFEDNTALVVNMRERGAHFEHFRGPDADLKKTLNEPDMIFPSLEKLELYDFQFNEVSSASEGLSSRIRIFHRFDNEEMCST